MTTTPARTDRSDDWITAHELDDMELRKSGDDVARLCRVVRRFRDRLGLDRSPVTVPQAMRRFLPVEDAARIRPGTAFTQWESEPPLCVLRVVGFVPGIGDDRLVLAIDVRHASASELAAAEEWEARVSGVYPSR
jgi:hypothetical protein